MCSPLHYACNTILQTNIFGDPSLTFNDIFTLVLEFQHTNWSRGGGGGAAAVTFRQVRPQRLSISLTHY